MKFTEMDKKIIAFVPYYQWWITTLPRNMNYFSWVLEVAAQQWHKPYLIFYKSDKGCIDEFHYLVDIGVTIVHIDSLWKLLSFVFLHRKSLFYINTLAPISLFLCILIKKSIFMSHHQSLKPSSFLKRILCVMIYKHTSLIRVISPGEKKLLSQYGIDNTKLIPLVVERDFVYPPNPSQDLLLLWFLRDIKDPLTIIKAIAIVIKKYPHIRVYHYGDISFTYQWKTLIDILKEQNVYSNFIAMGIQPLNKIHSKTGIYINSSKAEWQCLAVYDAILLWNAVCVPNIPSFDGVLDDMVLKHEVGDFEKLASNIIWYIENPWKRIDMIQKNQERIRLRYNYSTISRSLWNMLKLYI